MCGHFSYPKISMWQTPLHIPLYEKKSASAQTATNYHLIDLCLYDGWFCAHKIHELFDRNETFPPIRRSQSRFNRLQLGHRCVINLCGALLRSGRQWRHVRQRNCRLRRSAAASDIDTDKDNLTHATYRLRAHLSRTDDVLTARC